MTLGELAAHERVAPPTMTAIVGRLDEAGLVTREADPEDRRVSRVRLTAAGARLLERTRSQKAAYLARRLARLTPAERDVLEEAASLFERLVER